jgi:2-isopropylmalate synthase
MARERIYIYDTTLRDGQQTPGIDFSVEDKKAIVILLEELGVDYVEGGYPGANPTDTAFFKKRQTSRAKFAAFGMTKRAGVSASNDPGLTALLQAMQSVLLPKAGITMCGSLSVAPMRKIWNRLLHR